MSFMRLGRRVEVADHNKDFRASHAKKTVKKFGATYR